MLKSKYVDIIRDKDEKDELVFDVVNKKDEVLGRIYYHSKWRKFVFDCESAFFDDECLNVISSYLTWLTLTKKRGLLKESSR